MRAESRLEDEIGNAWKREWTPTTRGARSAKTRLWPPRPGGEQTAASHTPAGLTLSWVNKLGSEDSGAPPADSPGTSSRVVRTSFASIPGLSL